MMNSYCVNNLTAIAIGAFFSLSFPCKSFAQEGNSIPIPGVGVSRHGNPLVSPKISNTAKDPFHSNSPIVFPKNPLAIKKAKSFKGVIHIPNDAIQIDVQYFSRPFFVRNLNRRFKANELIPFLKDYFEGSKAERTNPILIRQNTKVMMPGENQFNEFLQSLSDKHKIMVVHMPAPMSAMTDQTFENYAKRKLKPFNNQNHLNQKKPTKKTNDQRSSRNEGPSGR